MYKNEMIVLSRIISPSQIVKRSSHFFQNNYVSRRRKKQQHITMQLITNEL